MDPRITFTRASTATFTGQNGLIQTAAVNVPRFDYNPTTLAPLGLLIEEQRANLLTYSEQFNNAAWTKTRSSITANTIVAPDGTLTGDKLVEDTTASASHPLISLYLTVVVGSTQSFSIYAKAAERSAIVLRLNAASDSIWAAFNLSTGSVGTVANSGTGSGATGSIQAVGNGWFRCTLTGVFSSTSAFPQAIIYPAVSATDPTNTSIIYTGNGYSGLFLWGAQLEAGAFPTSYIQTVASQVTRSADVASMTGTNFSSWYNAAEGSVYSQIVKSSSNIGGAWDINAGGTANSIRLTPNNTTQFYRVNTSSIEQVAFDIAASSNGSKAIITYRVNDFAASVNGGAVSTDTSGSIPVVDRLLIGSFNTVGANNLNGHIQQIVYYPRRLSNAQLQALTS